MITIQEIRSAIRGAEPLFDRLDELYGCLPVTRCVCDRPGVCCTFLPEMTFLEALRWLQVLLDRSPAARNELLCRFVKFYFSNPVRLERCPFLEDGACTIYPYRTFACRAYGLWSAAMGRSRTRQSREEKKALRRMWKRFGVELPSEAVEFEIDYCLDVQVPGGTAPSDRDLLDLLEEVYGLGASLPGLQSRFEEEFHSDFSFLVTALVFGLKKTVMMKFAIVKELAEEGTAHRLHRALAQAASRGLPG